METLRKGSIDNVKKFLEEHIEIYTLASKQGDPYSVQARHYAEAFKFVLGHVNQVIEDERLKTSELSKIMKGFDVNER